MRAMLGLLILMWITPTSAADWGYYVNARFGYAIDVPPGFAAQGEAANGDGQEFTIPTAKLAAYGMTILEGDFEAQVRQDEENARQDGWNITYQVSTPTYASYSGIKNSRVLYARMISLCGGTFGAFTLEYGRADIPKFDPVITRLVRSLKPTEGSVACPAAN